MSAIIPIPRIAITVRPGTMDDLPFLDALQRMHTKQVGWMPTKQLEGKIRDGHVLVAEDRSSALGVRSSGEDRPNAECRMPNAEPLGYIIAQDRYFKRDDVGIVYQLNVAPGNQRKLIGATLLKAVFDRAAYGCRLYCCWCAQDIEANYFWESLGFVPLAFRAGSRGKGRIHIFWQKRIRSGDVTTPWWFPSQTSAGSIREDRLVLPIPPGKHWRDVMPIVLPALSGVEGPGANQEPLALDGPDRKRTAEPKAKVEPKRATTVQLSGISFSPPPPPAREKPKPVPKAKAKAKNDPTLIAAARELRDRWLEHVNAGGMSELISEGKYDLTRALPQRPSPAGMLPAA